MAEPIKKGQVADKGVRLMNRNGYSSVTMTQIEEAIFPSEGTPECPAPEGDIYKLFTSKEELAVEWLISSMTTSFDEVAKRISGYGQKAVKLYLNSLFDVWLRTLTKRRVFVEGFAVSLLVKGSLERRAIDRFIDTTHEMLEERFMRPFYNELSIPDDDERLFERHAIFSIQGALGLSTLFWLQDRTSAFNDSYHLNEILADVIVLTLAKSGGGVDRGLLQAGYDLRELLVKQTALASLEKLLPQNYLEGLPWNIVKMLYKKDE